MSEQLLTLLKLCLLVLLYLFFLRVLRAVWVEIRGPKTTERRATSPAPAVAGAGAGAVMVPADAGAKGRKAKGRAKAVSAATRLVVVEPADQRGRTYPLGNEITVGRAAGCQVTLDDTYASQIHARLFRQDGQVLVEDLGSTNGTTLNKKKVTGPTMMKVGDRVTVGSTTLELT